VRAPGRLGEGRSRGPRLPQRFSPQSPLRLVQRYSESLAVDCGVPATASIYSRSEVEAFLGTGPPPLTTKHPLMRSRCLWLTHERVEALVLAYGGLHSRPPARLSKNASGKDLSALRRLTNQRPSLSERKRPRASIAGMGAASALTTGRRVPVVGL